MNGAQVAIFFGLLVGLGLIATRVAAFKPYLRKMPMVAFLLGISSGFPLTLLLATMTFWQSKVGIDKATIGFAIGRIRKGTLRLRLTDSHSISTPSPTCS